MALNHKLKMSFNATRDLLADLVSKDADLLMKEHIITYDIAFSNCNLVEAVAGKTLEAKAFFRHGPLNYPTVVKSKHVKVQGGNNDFSASAKGIYEGGHALEFQLLQTSLLFGSTTVASAEVSLQEFMNITPKETSQAGVCIEKAVELQSVEADGKHIGTLYVTLHVDEATLEMAGGFTALKVVKLDRPPARVCAENAKKFVEFHRRSSAVIDELDKIFDQHPVVPTKKKQARIDARMAREKQRQKLSDAEVQEVEASIGREMSIKPAGGYNPLACCKADPKDEGTEAMGEDPW